MRFMKKIYGMFIKNTLLKRNSNDYIIEAQVIEFCLGLRTTKKK